MTNLLHWDIYEISTKESPINGVMFRGRIRKLGLEKQFNVLVENSQDAENGVRFAVLEETSVEQVANYVHSILDDSVIVLVAKSVANPVLSKLKVNQESRYKL